MTTDTNQTQINTATFALCMRLFSIYERFLAIIAQRSLFQLLCIMLICCAATVLGYVSSLVFTMLLDKWMTLYFDEVSIQQNIIKALSMQWGVSAFYYIIRFYFIAEAYNAFITIYSMRYLRGENASMSSGLRFLFAGGYRRVLHYAFVSWVKSSWPLLCAMLLFSMSYLVLLTDHLVISIVASLCHVLSILCALYGGYRFLKCHILWLFALNIICDQPNVSSCEALSRSEHLVREIGVLKTYCVGKLVPILLAMIVLSLVLMLLSSVWLLGLSFMLTIMLLQAAMLVSSFLYTERYPQSAQSS